MKNRCFICQKRFKNTENDFKRKGNCCTNCDRWAEVISKTKGDSDKQSLRLLWEEEIIQNGIRQD